MSMPDGAANGPEYLIDVRACGVVVMITMLMLGALTLVRDREEGNWEGLLRDAGDRARRHGWQTRAVRGGRRGAGCGRYHSRENPLRPAGARQCDHSPTCERRVRFSPI